MWNFDVLTEEDIEQVKVLFNAGEYTKLHHLYAEKGVIPGYSCDSCQNFLLIKDYTIYALNVIWKPGGSHENPHE